MVQGEAEAWPLSGVLLARWPAVSSSALLPKIARSTGRAFKDLLGSMRTRTRPRSDARTTRLALIERLARVDEHTAVARSTQIARI